VHRQTYPASEVLIVDDGSTDPYTRQVLHRLKNAGTCVVPTPNRGVAAARNSGIRLTSSPYIVLLDADDLLEAIYLEKAAHLLDERSDLDLVTCAIQAFEGASYTWTPPPCTLVDTLTRGGPHISTMFRRTLWETLGGFDEGLPGYEDTDFWLSALETGGRGTVLDEPLLRYRVRRNSRYQQAIARGTYVPTMETIYRKHRRPVSSHSAELLQAKEAFLVELNDHRRRLELRREELNHELARCQGEVARAAGELRDEGKEAFDWGDLRRITPIREAAESNERDSLADWYIRRFLGLHQEDVQGHVLETRDSRYTAEFGASRVARGDVLDTDPANPKATLIADLSRADSIPPDSFDCLILIQTLQFIYDFSAALSHAYRILKPGGVLLGTLPCVSPVADAEGGGATRDFWRFTEASVRNMFSEVFPVASFEIIAFGNVMAYAALLHGLPAADLAPEELDDRDPLFPLICCIRAVKPGASEARQPGEGGRTSVSVGSQSSATSAGAILYYHRIAALVPDTHGLCVTPENFRAHMKYLREDCQPMALQDFVAAARSGDLPAGAIAVTLDDGYLTCLDVVSPILLEFGISATFFINTDRMNEPHEFWWDTLERVLLSGSPVPTVLDLYGDGRWVRPTSSEDERAAAHQALFEAMYSMLPEEREAALARLAAWSGMDLTPRPTHRPMTDDEVRELAARPGHSIGAHTVHHSCLPALPPEIQRHEVAGSREYLESLTGRPVKAFSYPYGEFNRQTMEIVLQADFDCAVTVENRVVRLGTERLLLPRFEIKDCSAADYAEFLQRIFSR
jgi:peptidoglycan/xylan/chitin deacetylase (PgdA/CDA1 family)/SAM-dependent methyltransferase